jgi:hypothetical protein
MDFSELDEFVRDLDPDKITQAFRPAFRDSLAWLEYDAKANAPVDRGKLRQSINTRLTGSGLSLKGEVGPNVEVYGHVMEFGAKPFWPNVGALMGWVKRVIAPPAEMLDSVTFLIGRKISRSGIAARRYMGRALDKNRARIWARMNRALNEAVGRLAK